MKMSWEEEFNQALASFGVIVPEPIEYRVHYDDTGKITMCTMQQHPENTKYLVVEKDVYDNASRYYVNLERNRLEKIALDLGISVKLKKSDQGYAVVKNHAGLILEKNEKYPTIEYYDTVN